MAAIWLTVCHSQRKDVDFIDAELDAANRKEALAIEPLPDEFFG